MHNEEDGDWGRYAADCIRNVWGGKPDADPVKGKKVEKEDNQLPVQIEQKGDMQS